MYLYHYCNELSQILTNVDADEQLDVDPIPNALVDRVLYIDTALHHVQCCSNRQLTAVRAAFLNLSAHLAQQISSGAEIEQRLQQLTSAVHVLTGSFDMFISQLGMIDLHEKIATPDMTKLLDCSREPRARAALTRILRDHAQIQTLIGQVQSQLQSVEADVVKVSTT